MVAGIDVSAAGMVCVALDGALRVREARAFTATTDAATWAAGREVVCIDAPAQLSRGPHAPPDGLAPRFRTALRRGRARP